MQHCRQLTDPPYKRRDATASGQNATETQAIVPAAIPAADAGTSNT